MLTKLINFLQNEIRQCEAGVDDTGEPLSDAGTVHLDISDVKDIISVLKGYRPRLTSEEEELLEDALDSYESNAGSFLSYDEMMYMRSQIKIIKDKLIS